MDKFEKVPTGIFNKIENNKQEFLSKFINNLEELFPETVKDGIVDFQALLDRFGEYEEESEEKYNMTWIGKGKAIQEADEDIYGRTLKYVEDESKNPETTENLYIEGDNLEVLRLLRNSYYRKIKMIYIDPPYNRGEDLIYKDNFTMTQEEYDELSGSVDEHGERLVKNLSDSGRYHSAWLSMMYPRLKIAKDLLTDDGLIFISIDENEVDNLIKICNEVFGEKNHLNTITVKMSEASGNKMAHADKRLPKLKEYVLLYGKKNSKLNIVKVSKSEWDSEYNVLFDNLTIEQRNTINTISLKYEKSEEDIKSVDSILKELKPISVAKKLNELGITNEDDKLEWLYENAFRIYRTASSSSVKLLCEEKKKYNNNIFFSVVSKKEKLLYFIKSDYVSSSKSPRVQILFADDHLAVSVGDFWSDINTTGLEFEGDVPYKNGKKPLKLLKRLLELSSKKDSIILDFFAGSSTTAQAVMIQNNEDGGNRKFIMVQLPEDLDKSYDKSTGDTKKQLKEMIEFLDSIKRQHYLSEIGKERIRRAGEMILKEAQEKGKAVENLDIGFKVFKTVDTNLKMIKDTVKRGISMEEHKSVSPKDDLDFNPHFTDLDIVYEMILRRQDITLTEEILLLDNIGYRTYLIGNTVLVCLEDKVTEDMARKIGEITTNLSWIIMRDSAFEGNINLKINTVNLLRSVVKENHKKEQKIYWI